MAAKAPSKAPRKARRRSRLGCFVRLVVVGTLLAILAGVGTVAGVVWHFSQDLPDIREAQDYRPRQLSRIYAADGSVIATLTDEHAIYRTVIGYDDIPQVMRDAILSAEDADFYEHPGVDWIGVARAVVINLRRGSMSQGASTITQQVVKNLVLSPERSFERKIREALLSFRLEDNLTKDEILTIYLNEVFFGVRYYGVEEASRYYFGHSARDLTLPEAALLAGLVQSPNRYNPYEHPERALERRSYVLRQMWEEGYVEEGAYREADDAPLELADRSAVDPWDGAVPWYTDAVRRELLEHFDADQIFTGGLHVHTALDLPTQLVVRDALQAGLRAFDGRHGFHTPYATVEGDEGIAAWRAEHHADVATVGLATDTQYRAVVLASDEAQTRMAIGPLEVELVRDPISRMRPDDRTWAELFAPGMVFTVTPVAAHPPGSTGDALPRVRFLPSAEGAAVVIDPSTRRVLALVGGYDFSMSPFHRAVQAARQVGSAFKPYVYGAAIDARVATPATIYQDQPVTFPMPGGQTWSPRNYDGRYLGSMSLRTALARSRNVIAVRVLDQVGLGPAQAFARDLGIEAPLTDNLTMALGSAEITPLEMTNAMATLATGGVWAEPVLIVAVRDGAGGTLYEAPDVSEPRVDPAVAWLTTSMMRSVVDRGTATRARTVGHPAAGKTGTTNDARDAWFVGFTPQRVAGVWVGRDDNATLGRGENGSATALPIWVDLMTRLHESLEVVPFADPPDGIVAVDIDPATGLLARPGQDDAEREYFLAGTEPRSVAPAPDERATDDVLLHGGAGGQGGTDDDEPTTDGAFDGF